MNAKNRTTMTRKSLMKILFLRGYADIMISFFHHDNSRRMPAYIDDVSKQKVAAIEAYHSRMLTMNDNREDSDEQEVLQVDDDQRGL
jgi:hypothetical protein